MILIYIYIGIDVVSGAEVQSVTKETDNTLTLTLKNGKIFTGFDFVMSAIGIVVYII